MSVEIVEMFDTIVARYDLLNRFLSLFLDQRWRRKTVRRVLQNGKVLPGEEGGLRILDGCTGTGDLAILLAKEPMVAEVVGVDAAISMLDRAQMKTDDTSVVASVRYQQADMYWLPFANDSFDAITISFGFRNLHRYEDALQEMVRVLRPGGCIAILEFAPPADGLRGFLYRLYLWIIPALATLLLGKLSAYRYLGSSIRGFLSPGEMLTLLRKHRVKHTMGTNIFFEGVYLYTGCI
ncbi:MAG: ubiquinone/menaquinone biosynthesis methyltransferase [Alkalispirochaeta sp.]